MFKNILNYALQDLTLTLLLIAVFLPMIGKKTLIKKRIAALVFILPVGVSSLWSFIYYVAYGSVPNMDSSITNIFEFQLAIINLAIGVSGILAGFFNRSYKAAIALIMTILLWGTAIDFIYQVASYDSIYVSSFGSNFYTDIILPIVMWVCIIITNDKEVDPQRGLRV